MAGSRVVIPVNGRTIAGYLSPASTGSGPGVIVIQEWWGLVPHIENVCDRLAAEGFTCLAPDLYHGESTTSPDQAGKLMMALEIAETERDLRAAIQYLLASPFVKGTHVGTVGFCMGGQLSLYAACENRAVGAAVDFYGVHPNVSLAVEKLTAPVLGFFAGRDQMVTRTVADELEGRLRASGKRVTFHHYAEAQHGFFNDTRPVHDPAAAADAWEKLLTFFRAHLS